ncbi:MAG: hypothetical protein ACR2PZ_09500 [Pseudomonadales bacterium]
MKFSLSILSLLAASLAFADNHERQYGGMNLAQANVVQMQLCSLKPRKSMADYDKVMNGYIKWSKDNDVQTYVMRLTPLFVTPPGGDGPAFEWIDMLISPFETSGDGWNKWLNTESGQRLNAQWIAAADCRVTMNPIFNQFIDAEALSADSRIVTFNWCTANEGVTADALIARHDSMAASRPDDAAIKAWNIIIPGLGNRNPPGDFAHFLSFSDTKGLMAYQNALANGGGWRQRQDYNASYATCTGENVYAGQILNRP